MAYAQVSLVSAVKAAPTAKVSRNTRRNTTAVKVVANKAGAARVEVARKAAPVALSVGTVFAASSANAMDLVAAVPQEVAAIADITPIAYFAFLGGSVAFALGTYIALTKIKLI